MIQFHDQGFKHIVGKQSSILLVDIPSVCLKNMRMEEKIPENRIKELREHAGLTLQELADKAGTSNQQISMLENAKRKLDVTWMNRLAPHLKVRPSELMLIPSTLQRIRLIGGIMAQTPQEVNTLAA